ncbi:MAG: RecX family transcriptional regulator [Clostridium sp.]|nr:RecX family transcriptional regulator [Clostridium sp.]MCM1444770.1 RecX family transcriptional regulator [Candidatus Amulumruptor caecigallinarius]
MKIKKIEKQKSSNKYKIIFEDGTFINTYDNVILNNNLLFDKDIDDELIEKINKENSYYEIYNKTIKFIQKRLRSEKEVDEYIGDYKYKKRIIEDLKKIKLINDTSYIKAYISDRIYLNLEGPNKIKKDLLNQNIEELEIDKYIGQIDENIILENLNKLISKRIKSNTRYSNYILIQKIKDEMLKKGYCLEMISSILENVKITDKSIIEKEYKKLYDKLSKKYCDKELELKIRQKLYQKGFKLDDIDNIL